MSIVQIYKGIGKGSLFGREYGRLFGIHLRKSKMSDLGKASDPYINIRTLARLSKSEDQAVRAAVVVNLIGKLRIGFNPKLLRKFDNDLVRKALLDLAKNEDNPAGVHAYLTAENISSMSADEAEILSASVNPIVLLKIIGHPNAKRETIVKLAAVGKTDEQDGRIVEVSRKAYEKIEKMGVTTDELRKIAHTPDWWILFRALARPEFPRDLKLKMVARSNARVAEEAWTQLDKRSLTAEELRYLSQTRSGLARIEIKKHPLTPDDVKKAY